MSNSYRIRTTPGVDKSIKVRIDQDFEYLEILSLKLLQSEVYTRKCSDYGVIVGRVSINNGFGVPNAKVSIFIPLSSDDEANNPIIADLYPYKTLSQVNDIGYRYNLLPSEQSYSNHVPTGSFFTRKDVLTNQTKIEIYDKYYKYNAITNESGDYMIFGVPVGSQTIVVNVDLSDIGDFSLSPQDLIRMGVATPAQVDGTKFKSSTNINELPQIITINRTLEVEPLWGDETLCNLGITRTDFDLSAEKNINIQPTSIFMGSLISSNDDESLKLKCKPALKSGSLCSLVSGPGKIQAIRQTIRTDINGRPALEVADLEEGGQVIDDNGTWLFDVPMNLDYVVTNEFGEQVISNDPKKGIPTKGKYRFKISWNQPDDLGERVKRANFLVPNIKEYGWVTSNGTDPLTGKSVASRQSFGNIDNPCDYDSTVPTTDRGRAAKSSYAFSLDWEDYGQRNSVGVLTQTGQNMILEAINCQDRFFEMQYNKVYTVSQLISEYRRGASNNRIISIKNILDDSCESTNNKFPANDGMYRFDIIFILFQILMLISYALLFIVIFLFHLFIWVLCKVIKPIIGLLKDFFCWLKGIGFSIVAITWYPFKGFAGQRCTELTNLYNALEKKCKEASLNLPNITYPDCELCACDPQPPKDTPPSPTGPIQVPNSANANIIISGEYNGPFNKTDGEDGNFMPSKGNDNVFISGVQMGPSADSSVKGAPTDVASLAEGDCERTFSTDLPWHERFNLFNTKAKYFEPDDTTNPGGGVNRIAVRFNTGLNGGDLPNGSYDVPTGKYHLDNVIAVLIDADMASTFSDGSLFTTVDPQKSTDTNLSNVSPINDLGTNSITGSTIGLPYNSNDKINQTDVEVKYANPNGTGGSNLSVIYSVTGDSATSYHKFPIDLEYFQVIHSVPVSTYIKDVTTTIGSPNLPNSFFSRVLNGGYRMVTTSCDPNNPAVAGVRYYNTLRGTGSSASGVACQTPGGNACIGEIRKYFPDSDNLQVVFMVRGVDPNSPKTRISYDIIRLYGQKKYGKKIVTLDNVKMNIPVQGTFRCVDHKLTNSTNKDTSYSNIKLFYKTFMWKPSSGTLQVGPEIDPATVTDYNANNEPLNGTVYNPASKDPFYRPAGYCDFKSFTTINHKYYSLIDETTQQGSPFGANYTYIHRPVSQGGLRIYGDIDDIRRGRANAYAAWYNKQPGYGDSISPFTEYSLAVYAYRNRPDSDDGSDNTSQNNQDKKNRGYFHNESVEGGNIALLQQTNYDYWNPTADWYKFYYTDNILRASQYIGLTYASYAFPVMTVDSGDEGREIVMRSDRLPSSSFEERNKGTLSHFSYSLMANNNFSYYQIGDDGSVSSLEGSSSTSGVGGSIDSAASNAEAECGGDILSTFTCEGLVPLDCYHYDQASGHIKVWPKLNPIPNPGNPGDCYGNRLTAGSNSEYGQQPESIMTTGCYNLCTVPFETLELDYKLLKEWRARMVVSFAACRNVFSHYFTNNWVNGTLYAFSFVNSRRFTSPTDPNPNKRNKPYNCFCKNNIYFNTDSNNFYYRSTPYNSTEDSYVGRKNPINWLTGNPFGGNTNNLMFPTTIMDLGPRDVYTQEIAFSNDYDGYVMKNLNTTTFKDISDLLNTFIISRFINKTVMDKILSAVGVSAVTKYFSRKNLKIDGDYAQMLSINSELGTVGFSDENYGTCDIFYNGGNSTNGVFGVYFSSDTQVRDFVTPKRTIISEEKPLNEIDCAFEYFKVKTQKVPYYQWFIKPNQNNDDDYKNGDPLFPSNAPVDSIFGSQLNDWSTNPYSGTSTTSKGTFFTYGYQNLDRLLRNSRYFRTSGSLLTKYYRSNIYSVDPTLNMTDDARAKTQYWDKNSQFGEPQFERVVNTGAPFYFYFGLNKGKSAFDRFTKKWIDTEVITD
jgi:hypothetical protein